MRNAGGHHRRALEAAIQSVAGVSTTLEGVATSGMLDRDLIRIMIRNAGAAPADFEGRMNEIIRVAHEHFGRNCVPSLENCLCTGVTSCVANLADAGAVLGIVSGNIGQIGWRKLELAGLREYFRVGAFSEDGHTRAELARIARDRAIASGYVQPEARVALIGDHWNDINAAKSNGFLAIAVATGLTPREALVEHNPDILLNDLSELDFSLLL